MLVSIGDSIGKCITDGLTDKEGIINVVGTRDGMEDSWCDGSNDGFNEDFVKVGSNEFLNNGWSDGAIYPSKDGWDDASNEGNRLGPIGNSVGAFSEGIIDKEGDSSNVGTDVKDGSNDASDNFSSDGWSDGAIYPSKVGCDEDSNEGKRLVSIGYSVGVFSKEGLIDKDGDNSNVGTGDSMSDFWNDGSNEGFNEDSERDGSDSFSSDGWKDGAIYPSKVGWIESSNEGKRLISVGKSVAVFSTEGLTDKEGDNSNIGTSDGMSDAWNDASNDGFNEDSTMDGLDDFLSDGWSDGAMYPLTVGCDEGFNEGARLDSIGDFVDEFNDGLVEDIIEGSLDIQDEGWFDLLEEGIADGSWGVELTLSTTGAALGAFVSSATEGRVEGKNDDSTDVSWEGNKEFCGGSSKEGCRDGSEDSS